MFLEIKLICEHSLKTFACQTFGIFRKQILCMSITKFYSTLKKMLWWFPEEGLGKE